jgi:hypothetical protein
MIYYIAYHIYHLPYLANPGERSRRNTSNLDTIIGYSAIAYCTVKQQTLIFRNKREK